MKRKILPELDDPLIDQALHAVLIDIFCNAMLEVKNWKFVLASFFGILAIFIMFPLSLISKFTHLLIWIILCILFFSHLVELGSLGLIIAFGGFLAIMYKDIHQDLNLVLAYIWVILTMGNVVKKYCEKYLEGSFIRGLIMKKSTLINSLMSVFINLAPRKYSNQWEYLTELTSNIINEESKKQLEIELDKYWQQAD